MFRERYLALPSYVRENVAVAINACKFFVVRFITQFGLS